MQPASIICRSRLKAGFCKHPTLKVNGSWTLVLTEIPRPISLEDIKRGKSGLNQPERLSSDAVWKLNSVLQSATDQTRTCQVIQSLQNLLLSGKVQRKVVKRFIQVHVRDEYLGGGRCHGNPFRGQSWHGGETGRAGEMEASVREQKKKTRKGGQHGENRQVNQFKIKKTAATDRMSAGEFKYQPC